MAQRAQLNLRLDKDWFDVLDAASTVQRRGLAEYVKTLLEEHVTTLRTDPMVRKQLQVWAEAKGIAEGSITPLSAHRRKRGTR